MLGSGSIGIDAIASAGVADAGGGTLVTLTLSATIGPASALAKMTATLVGGTVAPAGIVRKLVATDIGGVLQPAGTVGKAIAKTLGAAVGIGGLIRMGIARVVGGSIGPAGAVAGLVGTVAGPAPASRTRAIRWDDRIRRIVRDIRTFNIFRRH